MATTRKSKARKAVQKPAAHQIGDTLYLSSDAAREYESVKGVWVSSTDDNRLVLQTEGRKALLVGCSEVLSPAATKELDTELGELVLAVARLGDAKRDIRRLTGIIAGCYIPEDIAMIVMDVQDESDEPEGNYCADCDADCEPGCHCPEIECDCLK
jgi:hypothetical protein